HPELVATGHVPGGADVDHAGMLLQEPPDVADPEPGEGVGRAHDCDPEAFLRGDVVAVACLAPHPLDAVDTPHPGTDRLAWGRRLGPAEIPPARPLHCLDDLAVPGAPAQIPGEPREDVVLCGLGRLPQDLHRRDEDPGDAEAALG